MASKRGASAGSAIQERGSESIKRSVSYEHELDAQGVYRTNGQLMRVVDRPAGSETEEDGSVYAIYTEQERPVELTLDEARRLGHDYFDPEEGWIRYGLKREREAPENVGSATAGMHKVKRVPIGGPAAKAAAKASAKPAPASSDAPVLEGDDGDGV